MEDMKSFECCSFCLEIAMDAAYSDGFQTEDDEYVVIDDDTFNPVTILTEGDAGDILLEDDYE